MKMSSGLYHITGTCIGVLYHADAPTGIAIDFADDPPYVEEMSRERVEGLFRYGVDEFIPIVEVAEGLQQLLMNKMVGKAKGTKDKKIVSMFTGELSYN